MSFERQSSFSVLVCVKPVCHYINQLTNHDDYPIIILVQLCLVFFFCSLGVYGNGSFVIIFMWYWANIVLISKFSAFIYFLLPSQQCTWSNSLSVSGGYIFAVYENAAPVCDVYLYKRCVCVQLLQLQVSISCF